MSLLKTCGSNEYTHWFSLQDVYQPTCIFNAKKILIETRDP